jgi:hypothetical protein
MFAMYKQSGIVVGYLYGSSASGYIVTISNISITSFFTFTMDQVGTFAGWSQKANMTVTNSSIRVDTPSSDGYGAAVGKLDGGWI